jgi:hypothetical protein
MNQKEQQGTGLAVEQGQTVNRREQQETGLAAEQSQTVNRREQQGTGLTAEQNKTTKMIIILLLTLFLKLKMSQ